jgi:hypothetical protein
MTKNRILIAGHEIGGQMQLLAETLRGKGYHADAASFNIDFRKYSTDFNIASQKIPVQRLNFFLTAIFNYDVFHFFWGVSLLDFWRFTGIDLPFLKMLNKKIIVHFRGTDLVDIGYYQYLNARARGQKVVEPAKSRPDQLKRLEQWRKYADCLLVSTPDLLEIAPEAKLVPQVVDLNHFPAPQPSKMKSAFKIAHAPTRRNTKGTDFIIQAIDNLQAKGYKVELDLIENQSPEIVLQRFAQCDAGIDQLLSGWYGKASVELLALGKPVICFISSRYLDVYDGLPFVLATAENLEENIINLIERDSTDIKMRSIEYVRNYHDVHTVVDGLLDLYFNGG